MTFGLRVIPPTALAAIGVASAPGSAPLHQAITAEGVGPQAIAPEVLLGDLAFFSESRVLRPSRIKGGARQIIMSQADSAPGFAIFDTDARQISAAFSSRGDSCIWEAF